MNSDLIDTRVGHLATQLQSLPVEEAPIRLEAIAGFLRDFHKDFDFGAFLRFQLNAALEGTRDILVQAGRIELASSPHGVVSLGPVQASPMRMYLTSRLTALVVVGDTLELEVFSLGDDHDPDVFDEGAVLQPRGSLRLRDGQSYHFDGWRTLVHAGSSGSTMVLRYESAPRAHHRWVFDRAGLTSIGSIPTDLALLDRLDLFATAAVAGDGDSKHLLMSATTDRNPMVRWGAAETLSRMDPNLAVATIRRLAESDPHPDVRQAAMEKLANTAGAHSLGP